MRSSRRDGERHHEQAVRGEPSLFTADSQRRGCAEGEGIVRSALTALLVLHGAIHVLGFLAWSKLAPVPQLSGRTLVSFSKMGERIFALAWLLSLLVFLAAAVLRVVRHDAWWVLALVAVVLSQSLIVLACFSFDPRGRVVGMQAERYLGGGADAKLTPWLVTCSEWRRFEGIEVPSKGDVGWELESGYFSYYRWEILDLQFNRREPYREDDRPRAAAVEPIGRAALDRTGASR